jgi:hypothetical protein
VWAAAACGQQQRVGSRACGQQQRVSMVRQSVWRTAIRSRANHQGAEGVLRASRPEGAACVEAGRTPPTLNHVTQ